MAKSYYVYIMASMKNGTIYTGVTDDLLKRVYQHKNKLLGRFTKQYGVDMLVQFEETNDVSVALTREKQLKGWTRKKKIDLIQESNPEWRDLAEGWFE